MPRSSQKIWKEPVKGNLPVMEVREVLGQEVGTSRNKDSRVCTYPQGCRLGVPLGREGTEEQGH